MIGEAFTAMFRNPKIYLGAGVIALGLIGLAYVVFLVSFVSLMPTSGSLGAPVGSARSAQNIPIGSILTLYLILGLAFVLARVLMIGVCACTIEEADTGSTSYKTLFSPFGRFFPVAGCLILSQLAIIAGTMLCYVPGLYLMGVFAFAPEICLVEKIGPIKAIQKSYEMIKPFAWMMVLLMFVLSMLTMVGGVACGVGLAITFPIQFVVLGLHYREFRGPSRSNPQAPINPDYQLPIV